MRRAPFVYARDELTLYFQILDNGLNDPIGSGEACQILQAARTNERPRVRDKKWVRLEPASSPETGAGSLIGDIQEQNWKAGVGQMGGDLRSHRASAKDCGTLNLDHPASMK